ncbi:EscU/YscU/HrcU family type III secretion system export apparatus switch protein [Oceanobacillus sojae]|uniref:EscU/YscU/HrcU family type III secretion system export apparatus switch protein n=1 Tax=Oceanobacillus sojae TaxID=582851 RepID=UPI0021A4F295|nr:EscU/YscU/HrcU family type III secretion system export apparatus switch protein [Oceanobacillus sojae]MCT1904154.1 EscU/YscU/HrcU family type III secretion system export apparatus switch protein [Oceanobacillus sojae]
MNEKRKKAVALSYEQNMDDAPKVTASGKGFLAEEIIERAIEHNIPILEDPTLVELLGELDINEKIPEELFQVVSEVFAFIYRADQQTGKENSR